MDVVDDFTLRELARLLEVRVAAVAEEQGTLFPLEQLVSEFDAEHAEFHSP